MYIIIHTGDLSCIYAKSITKYTYTQRVCEARRIVWAESSWAESYVEVGRTRFGPNQPGPVRSRD